MGFQLSVALCFDFYYEIAGALFALSQEAAQGFLPLWNG